MFMNRFDNRVIKIAAVIVLLLRTLLSVADGGQATHRVTEDDFQKLKYANSVQLSPDGKMLCYWTGDGELWLVNVRVDNVPRKLGKGMFPLWSPNGKNLAYYSSESGTMQLWMRNMQSDRTEQITTVEGGIDPDPSTRFAGWIYDPLRYSWSPDSTKLVFASQILVGKRTFETEQHLDASNTSNKEGTPLILTRTTPAEWTLSEVFAHPPGRPQWAIWEKSASSSPGRAQSLSQGKINQLFTVDIQTKIIKQVTKNDSAYFHPDWSPDGRKITCASIEEPSMGENGWQFPPTNIYTVDVATGEKGILTTGAGQKLVPRWSPDGKWIAYCVTERFGMQSVFVVSGAGGEPVNLTSKLNRSVYQFHWAPDRKSIIVLAEDGVTYPLVRVGFPSGDLELLGESQPAYRWATSLSNSGSLAWEESGGNTSGLVRVLPAGASISYVLTDLNVQVKGWELGKQEVVHWKNNRGEELEGMLIKPVGYQQGRRYPLIVNCYPGLAFGLKPEQLLASRGYLIFFPNVRAPHVWMDPFKDPAYDHAAKGPQGWDVTVDDLTSGADELIRRGMVDPDRMGLFGFSNGGAVVNYVVSMTNRFKCAISVSAALSDWNRAALLKTDNKVISIWAGDRDPWHDPEGYIKLSAVYHTHTVTTPMLLAVGDDDDVGFLLDSIEMYNGLRWFGRDVTLLRYPGQGHGFTGAALKDFWNRENAFFDRFLMFEERTN